MLVTEPERSVSRFRARVWLLPVRPVEVCRQVNGHFHERTTMEQFPLVLIAVIIVLIWLFNSLNVLREYERGVIFRIGRLMGDKGLSIVIWPIDRIVRVSLRTITMDVPTQDVITKDNVSVKVNAVVYFRRSPHSCHRRSGELLVCGVAARANKATIGAR